MTIQTRTRVKWILLLLAVLLFILTACGGGGGCEHLSCLPETRVMEKIGELVEDGRDGIIDEGESALGDKILDIADELMK